MIRRLLITVWTLGCILIGARSGWTQAAPGLVDVPGTIGNLGNLGNFNLNPGIVGGGGAIPGAIVVKIRGEVQCMDCTLEEMGVEEAPGDLYQLSQGNTHMVIKVTKAVPDIAWEMVARHKLFLYPGEDPAQLQRLLSKSKPGKRVEVTAGVAPDQGNVIPLTVKVK